MVLPPYQGQGIGRTLYDQLYERLNQRGARLLTVTTREDQQGAIAFLQRRGFHPVIRELESRLQVSDFDSHRFQAALERVAAAGITIYSMRDLQSLDQAWMQKWWHLKWQVVPDMPTSEEFTRESLEDFERELFSPQVRLDAVFVAIDQTTGQWVGLSGVLLYPEEPTTLYVGITGVLADYRRRGIALALKV